MQYSTLRADVLLLLTALIWGIAFVPQRTAMEHLGPWSFTGLRFALGALLLAVVMFRVRASPAPRGPWWGGVGAGLLLFAGANFQQTGLVHTTAGKAGFITGLYVVIVPVLAALLGKHPRRTVWLAAAVAAVGLYFLSVPRSLAVNPGDLFVLVCAVIWAGHVLLIDALARRTDIMRLAVEQYAVVALLSLTIGLVTEEVPLAALRSAAGAIFYGGAVSVAVGYTLQVVAQRDAPPAHVAVVLSLEALFAAIAGWIWLGERLDRWELLGCGLMLAAFVLAQTRPHAGGAPTRRDPEPPVRPSG